MNKLTKKLILLATILAIFLGINMVERPSLAAAPTTEPTSLPVVQTPFTPYGLEVSGFNPQQEAIILKVLEAYARAVGGSEHLKSLIQTVKQVRPVKIYYDPKGVGANTQIRLSATVFSISKALRAGFNRYEAQTEEAHAQIVIGHEIGHLLLHAALLKTGRKWANIYQQRVQRDWTVFNDHRAPEEEAVTELSLKVQDMGYYHSTWIASLETDPGRITEIDAWISDFLAALADSE